jgi:predicted nucleic acid-binding protein
VEKLIVDASVVVAALLPDEPYNKAARRALQSTEDLITSSLLRHEVTNSLWQAVRANRVEFKGALMVLKEFEALRLLTRDAPCAEILELAKSLDRPATYDTSYLALAQAERAPLITADKRLYNALKGRFPWLLWIEEGMSSPSTDS